MSRTDQASCTFQSRATLGTLAFCLVFLPVSPAALAQQDWPAKPIRIIVANSPGAAIDLAGPGGMPPELAQRVNRLAASIVENPKFNQDLATVRWRNLDGAGSLQGTVDFIREKRARWAAFIKEIGIEPH